MSQNQTLPEESVFTADQFNAVSDLLKTKNDDHVVQFFAFEHLKPPLKDISFVFARQALFILENCPRNPERTVALRKLLESKDAAVRARFAK